jgi:aryl-alcohol dehydrogenase-like predicted oxidoreductase
MQYRSLGRTGLAVSRLCYGTMSFGGDADEATSKALFERCRQAGINFFDCADVYAGGRSESILGKLITSCRNEVVLASKAHFPSGDNRLARGSNRYHLVRAVEGSLKRLGTDRIDVLYLHHYDANTELEDTLRSLELLLQQGKILYPAASNFSAWQTVRALGISERHGWAPFACIQPMYNLLKRQAEVEILPMAAELGIGVCSYGPLAGGLLTGKYQKPGTSGRLSDNQTYKLRYGEASNHEGAARFSALAQELGVHPATLAVAWVAAHPAITCPILGARSVEQLEPALKALELELGRELYDKVSALTPAPAPANDRTEERRPS